MGRIKAGGLDPLLHRRFIIGSSLRGPSTSEPTKTDSNPGAEQHDAVSQIVLAPLELSPVPEPAVENGDSSLAPIPPQEGLHGASALPTASRVLEFPRPRS